MNTTSRSTHHILRRFLRNGAMAAVLAASAVSLVAPTRVAALSTVLMPAGYTCDSGMIRVSPPRAWASGSPEQVVWMNVLQRWNGRDWAPYGGGFAHIATFNNFGMSPTSWSVAPTTRGGMYINSRLNLPVQHQGYYRVFAWVGNSTMAYHGFVAGPNAYCWMP